MSKSGNLTALSAILNPSDVPTIFYAEDPPYLPRILIFYWPVHAVGSLASASRIRTTILSAAGFKSFGAFSVAPSSSYYSAVHKLPDDKQRDDICRGIAFALCRYFSEVPAEVKNAITEESLHRGSGIKWGQTHAAYITCHMSKVINVDEVIESLRPFAKMRPSSPTTPAKPLTSIRKTRPSVLPAEKGHQTPSRFGQFVTPSRRVPSSQTRKLPSPSISMSKSQVTSPSQKPSLDQMESLRFKMCEFVDTEDRYISRLQELIDLVTHQGRTPKSLSSKFGGTKSHNPVNAMLRFPTLLDQIKDLNMAFLEDIETTLQSSEEAALSFLQQPPNKLDQNQLMKDPIGILAFAKVLLNHFPKFPVPYREYLDLHSQISTNLDQFLREGTTSIQQAPSLLMEPAQRISRYGLYIDTMLPHLPPTSTVALRTLEKARKIIAEICEMEPAASTILDSLRVEHEARRRPLSPTKLLSGLTRSNGTIREAPALRGSLKERDTPRLFPSLSRSLSRRTKSRTHLPGILSEHDPEQISNIRSPPNDENRPMTSSSGMSTSSRRPPTAGSANSMPSMTTTNGTADYFKQALMRAEEENYKLLKENAELKKLVRECKCGGVRGGQL